MGAGSRPSRAGGRRGNDLLQDRVLDIIRQAHEGVELWVEVLYGPEREGSRVLLAGDESVGGFQLLAVDTVCSLAAVDGECEIFGHRGSTVVNDLLGKVSAVVGIE
jgi:hypothetical protein